MNMFMVNVEKRGIQASSIKCLMPVLPQKGDSIVAREEDSCYTIRGTVQQIEFDTNIQGCKITVLVEY